MSTICVASTAIRALVQIPSDLDNHASFSGRSPTLCASKRLLRQPFFKPSFTNVPRPRRRPEAPSAVAAPVEPGVIPYTQPTWTKFEMGKYPVYWETGDGQRPSAGSELTIYFNPAATMLEVTEEGVGFSGGFNSPAMCGDGQPRVMTKRSRGANCAPFYSMRINVPEHALSLEFSFTDGKAWHGPYQLTFEVPRRIQNMNKAQLDAALAKELAVEDGCEKAIFPDVLPVMTRCLLPAGGAVEGGNSCNLDIIAGCTDPDSPSYDPLAMVDDGTCELPLPEKK